VPRVEVLTCNLWLPVPIPEVGFVSMVSVNRKFYFVQVYVCVLVVREYVRVCSSADFNDARRPAVRCHPRMCRHCE